MIIHNIWKYYSCFGLISIIHIDLIKIIQKVGGTNDTQSPTFQKVGGTCPPRPPPLSDAHVRWYVHCMLDYLFHLWLFFGERMPSLYWLYHIIIWYIISITYITFSEVYNVFSIVSGRKRFSSHKSSIDFAIFIDISVVWFRKFSFLSRCMPRNSVTEVALLTLISVKFTFLL